MSFVRTLVFVAVAIALGAWLYLVEEPKAEKAARADFLVDVDPASVDKVRLAYPDAPAIEVVRDGSGWRLTAPIAYAADASVVDNFLTTVKETKIERRLAKTEAGPLASYGLDKDTGSQGRLEVTLKDGKALPAVVLGIATPVGYQAFARRDGSDEVYVIPLLLQSSIRKTPFDLRTKKLFEADSTGVRRVTLTGPGGKIELESKGDGLWSMTSPVSDRADTESVRSMLDSIATIDAIAFFDGEAADRKAFGLDDGAARFSAEREDGSKVEFSIGKEAADQPAGNYFERASDHQVAKVPDWVAKKFVPAADDLRDKRLLSCKLDEILGLTWTSGGETFTISREAAGKPWAIQPEVPGQVLNQRIVDNAVNALALARADEVVGDAAEGADLAKWGLDKPSAGLDVRTASGSCAALVGVAAPPPPPPAPGEPPRRPPGKEYFLHNAGRSAVLKASEHEYSRLAMKRSDFLEAAPKDGAASPAAAPTPADNE